MSEQDAAGETWEAVATEMAAWVADLQLENKALQRRIHDLELAGEYANGGARSHGGQHLGDDSFENCTNRECRATLADHDAAKPGTQQDAKASVVWEKHYNPESKMWELWWADNDPRGCIGDVYTEAYADRIIRDHTLAYADEHGERPRRPTQAAR